MNQTRPRSAPKYQLHSTNKSKFVSNFESFSLTLRLQDQYTPLSKWTTAAIPQSWRPKPVKKIYLQPLTTKMFRKSQQPPTPISVKVSVLLKIPSITSHTPTIIRASNLIDPYMPPLQSRVTVLCLHNSPFHHKASKHPNHLFYLMLSSTILKMVLRALSLKHPVIGNNALVLEP